ncbi:MAG TPA: hypothetical protein VII75_10390, partial [Thermoanaerobaculia bacterium]
VLNDLRFVMDLQPVLKNAVPITVDIVSIVLSGYRNYSITHADCSAALTHQLIADADHWMTHRV